MPRAVTKTKENSECSHLVVAAKHISGSFSSGVFTKLEEISLALDVFIFSLNLPLP